MTDNKSRKLTDDDFISVSELVDLVREIESGMQQRSAAAAETFTIKPLEWVDQSGGYGIDLKASTPFGGYAINRAFGVIRLEFLFDVQYDEDWLACESVEHGKKMALDHWQERIKEALSQVEKPETPISPQQQQNWISVDTSLPELGKPIWVWGGEFCVFGVRSSTSEHLDEWVWCECLVRWDNQNRRWKVKESWMADEDAKVTHWAELVVPPASKAD